MEPLSIVHTENSAGWGGQEIRILTEARGMLDRGEASALLEKPFEAEPLLRLVRDLLDRSATPATT